LEKKIIIDNEGVQREVCNSKLKHVESVNKWDLLLFSKKTEIEAETSSDQEEKMEALLPGIDSRN
jgi:hypothetical protein